MKFVGRVWEFEVDIEAGRELSLEYISDEFKSEKWAEHNIESVIVFELE